MPKKLTQQEFITKCKEIYKDESYDYSQVNYINNKYKIKVICSIHGAFEIFPSSFLSGRKCQLCTKIGKHKTELDKFIFESNELHNRFDTSYDYSKVNYINNKTKVTIVCSIHGPFDQTPEKHKAGQGCPKCNINGSHKRILKLEDVIHNFKKIHGDKYDYSLVDYKNSTTKVKIICDTHGVFEQLPNAHSVGKGCKLCHLDNLSSFSSSKAEKDIYNFIHSLSDNIVSNDKSIIQGELDIYLPDLKIAFEYNGLYWHSELHKDKNYHLNKTKQCEALGIKLIHIFEDDWLYKQSIIKSRIINLLGNSIPIYARKCKVVLLDNNTSKIFLNSNHLSGWVNSKVNVGLIYEGSLVAIMTFGKCRFKQDKTELLRFCTLSGFNVIGAASKLLKYYVKTYNDTNIMTYADRAWGSGMFYEQIGFKFDGYTPPNYFYVNRDRRENRFKYRKSQLVKQGFLETETEHSIMLSRKMYRIYDCGNLKFNYKED